KSNHLYDFGVYQALGRFRATTLSGLACVTTRGTLFCVLHGVSHFAPKPAVHFHKVVVSFSEEHAVVFTIEFCCVAQIANTFYDLMKNLIDVEQIDKSWRRELAVVRNLFLCVMRIPSEHFQHDRAGITE